jgi:hypothetical protein
MSIRPSRLRNRAREALSLVMVCVSFLLLIPPVPSVEGVSYNASTLLAPAALVFALGVAVNWRTGDSWLIARAKILLFIGFGVLLSQRLEFI